MPTKSKTRATYVLSGKVRDRDSSTANIVQSIASKPLSEDHSMTVTIQPLTLSVLPREERNEFLYHLNKKLSGEYPTIKDSSATAKEITSKD